MLRHNIKLDIMNVDKYVIYLEDLLVVWGPKLLFAMIILILGLRLITWISKMMDKGFQRKSIDASVYKFLVSIITVFLKVMLLLTVAGEIGIPTTSFVAIISACALAIGLALSGNLSHFASGVLILIFKPYKVGDLIKVGEHLGTVREIQIFNTILLTFENKKIIIPNSVVTSAAIVNVSSEGLMRCDVQFSVGGGQDIDHVRQIILDEMNRNDLILKEPASKVYVSNLSPIAIDLAVHPWIDPDNYWAVFFGLQENVKKAFIKHNIAGPQPSMSIYNN